MPLCFPTSNQSPQVQIIRSVLPIFQRQPLPLELVFALTCSLTTFTLLLPHFGHTIIIFSFPDDNTIIAYCNYECKTNVVQIINTVMGTIVLVIIMKKFEIPSIPPTTSKSIRFPNDLIEKVENAISGTTCAFTAFVIEAVRVALENLEEDETDSK